MEHNIKEHLKEVREFLGLSQEELAARAGLMPSAISHIEGGRREPNLKTLTKLTNALGVSSDRLLFGKKNEK
jgi:transcriptional regulator with XRE-family HTH domain